MTGEQVTFTVGEWETFDPLQSPIKTVLFKKLTLNSISFIIGRIFLYKTSDEIYYQVLAPSVYDYQDDFDILEDGTSSIDLKNNQNDQMHLNDVKLEVERLIKKYY